MQIVDSGPNPGGVQRRRTFGLTPSTHLAGRNLIRILPKSDVWARSSDVVMLSQRMGTRKVDDELVVLPRKRFGIHAKELSVASRLIVRLMLVPPYDYLCKHHENRHSPSNDGPGECARMIERLRDYLFNLRNRYQDGTSRTHLLAPSAVNRPLFISMDSLTPQFEQLAYFADYETRLSLLNFAQQMQYRLERPADMLQRVGYAVHSAL